MGTNLAIGVEKVDFVLSLSVIVLASVVFPMEYEFERYVYSKAVCCI